MSYTTAQPTPDEVRSLEGPVILEFGTNWCGICQAAQPDIHEGLGGTETPHIKVEDGPGRRLGRAYRIKLWPTLVFLQDGVEVTRVVRPTSSQVVASALAELVG